MSLYKRCTLYLIEKTCFWKQPLRGMNCQKGNELSKEFCQIKMKAAKVRYLDFKA